MVLKLAKHYAEKFFEAISIKVFWVSLITLGLNVYNHISCQLHLVTLKKSEVGPAQKPNM